MKFCRTCGKCCFSTEMQISEEDIAIIEKHNPDGWKRDKFCFLHEDIFQLKNHENHCIFLIPENNICKIYDFRPKGCQYYPLIFDIDKNQCIFDDDCPFKHEFYRHKPEYEKKCKELRKWVKISLLKE